MPNEDSPNGTNKGSTSNNQQGSRAVAVNPNQQLVMLKGLVGMLQQQNDALLSCMQDIGNFKKES